MGRYYVRRPDYGQEWEDATAITAQDSCDAAEEFAEHQCSRDPECYSAYESGVFLEVKDVDTGQVADVSVTVQFNPSFRSREERQPVQVGDRHE